MIDIVEARTIYQIEKKLAEIRADQRGEGPSGREKRIAAIKAANAEVRTPMRMKKIAVGKNSP